MRNHNTYMILRAVDLLSRPQGMTKQQMADELEVSPRTVERLLDLLEELGFPIIDEESEDGRKKRWKLLSDYVLKLPNIRIPEVRLDLTEIISLYLIRGEARLFRNTDIEKRVNRAFDKIGQFLPPEFFSQLERLSTLFVPTTKFVKDYADKQEIIEKLRDAMVNRKSCEATYFSFRANVYRAYKLNPLRFFEHDGGLYLFAYIHDYQEIRVLAVERLQRLALTREHFQHPADFDPEALLSTSFGIIFDEPFRAKIWFTRDVARYIRERTWAPGQAITENPDASITLVMETSGWLEVKRWVLSYGAQAEVLEPEMMRQEVAEELAQAAGRYA
jgi:predicted DNA-binding transcriptional regulator YafY